MLKAWCTWDRPWASQRFRISQVGEKLTDVVDSLEGKQTELAKAQDRFPNRVDLLPSDIREVTGRRVLDKNAAGESALKHIEDQDADVMVLDLKMPGMI